MAGCPPLIQGWCISVNENFEATRIAVVGTGYVGLTTGACLAHLGHEVVCADVVAEKIARLRDGDIPIVEDGLSEIVAEGLHSGRLSFTVGATGAVAGAEFVFLCLPTPMGYDGAADLGCLVAAVGEIAPRVEAGAVVVNKSTVPVGSVQLVADTLGRADVAVVSNPEFLREGSAVYDFLNPERIVIGGDDRGAVDRLARLFERIEAPRVLTDAATAEMIKYAANAFLASKLSFVNALANVCEAVGANVGEMLLGMGHDRRIGFEYLTPGPGWGGSCFPKDTRALLRMAEDHGHDFELLRGVIAANEGQFDRVAAKVTRMAGGSLAGRTVGVWGLAFKAGTDDVRESPALAVIRRLVARGARIRAFDPAVTRPVEGVEVVGGPYDAVRGAHVLCVLTDWPDFAAADLARVRLVMASPRIVDARNMLCPSTAEALGFAYEGIGRRPSAPPADLDLSDAAAGAAATAHDSPAIQAGWGERSPVDFGRQFSRRRR